MNSKEKNFVSMVIYICNSEKTVENFLYELIDIVEKKFDCSEIICVNDYSNDRSVDIIRKMAESVKNTSISILNLSHYHGLELAMNAGVDLAIGDFVYEFDSTILDFEEKDVMEVYNKALEGYDIVGACPEISQKMTSTIFYKLFNRFSLLPCEMHTQRFRILSRRVINRINSMNRYILYRKAIYVNCGLKNLDIFYQPNINMKRDSCSDRNQRRYRNRLAIDSLILFTEFGYKFSYAMTISMICVSILVSIYTLFIFILSNPIAGWTTTILFLAFSFFGLFGILTIIIKYLQILTDNTIRRKKYSFLGIEKLTK